MPPTFSLRVKARALGASAPMEVGSLPPLPQSASVSVTIFPHLAEQSTSGREAESADFRLLDVPKIFEELFPGLRVHMLSDDALANGRSNLPAFLRASWDSLRPVNIIVTHRNFLGNELLSKAGVRAEGRIPNAAVVAVSVSCKAGAPAKTIFFVRHCPTHHNVTKEGCGKMTTCASVDSWRNLGQQLTRGLTDVLIGSSALPRAVLSAVALQRDVTQEDLEAVRRMFGAPRAPESTVRSYVESHVCEANPQEGSYCSGASGTFNLTPGEDSTVIKSERLDPFRHSISF